MSLQHENDEKEDRLMRRKILLTAQAALLGEVTVALRALTLGWSSNQIHIRAIFDREMSDDDRESMARIAAQFVAAFPNHSLEEEFIRLDAPESVNPLYLMAWIYIRKEPDFSS